MNNIKKIFVTGGAGYVGSALVPHLLKNNYQVTVFDLMIYGSHVLQQDKKLKLIKGDIRNKELLEKVIPGHDAVIHLACISNDPSFELNPDLGKSINLDSFEPLVEISKKNKVKRFIYASSSSVYGVKKDKNVNEDMKLEPLTDYSKYKAQCEEILSKFASKNFVATTLRPATVCGYAPRQRLDVIVNILTNLAYHKREITIFGGSQLRPNIHVQDMVMAYDSTLKASEEIINNEIFNVGSVNETVLDIAKIVKNVIGEDVGFKFVKTNDNRSYHICSEKILKKLNFHCKFTIKDAVTDLKHAFEKKFLKDPLINENYFNIKRMQSIDLK